MKKNTLGDLNGYLFEQLEKLNDEDLKGEKLEEELKRNKAITDVAKNIIQNGNLVLQARKFADERLDIDKDSPKMLEG